MWITRHCRSRCTGRREIGQIFRRDLPLMLAEVYRRQQASLPLDAHLMLVDVVEWLLRVPSRTPRQVHISRELDGRVLSPTEIAGIRRVAHSLSMGYPVNMFLGKATATLRQRPRSGKKPHHLTDLVFADWGLLHFHLGPGMGVATDTSSSRAVTLANQIIADLRHAERVFREQYPDGRAHLFVAKDASVGFYFPEQDCACSVLPARTSQARVTWFFQRLLEETGWFAAQPAGTIWHAPLTLA